MIRWLKRLFKKGRRREFERDFVRLYFDSEYYLKEYADVRKAAIDPFTHYLTHGWREGRDPRPDFSVTKYLERHPDARQQELEPLLHYLSNGGSPFSDENFGESNRTRKIPPKMTTESGFPEFLTRSLLEPTVHIPFTEELKRSFATMESIRKSTCKLAQDSEWVPLISIIMPAWNREDIIEQAINSVLAQTYENFELIVINDGSNDQTTTRALVSRDSRVRVIEIDIRAGASAARNVGLAQAKGELIGYLDSDNLMHEDFLLAMLGAFVRREDADLIYCGQLIFAGISQSPNAVRFGSYNPAFLENRNYIDLNTVMHRRKLITMIGGFDVNLRRLNDWDFILRAAGRCKIVSAPMLLSFYRTAMSADTISSTESFSDAHAKVRWMQSNRRSARLKTQPGMDVGQLSKGVSVVVPSFGVPEQLRNCIASLDQGQLSDDCELIIVDNNSGDAVQAFLDQIECRPQVRIIRNDENYGFSYAVNQGAAVAATGNDLLILTDIPHMTGVGAPDWAISACRATLDAGRGAKDARHEPRRLAASP